MLQSTVLARPLPEFLVTQFSLVPFTQFSSAIECTVLFSQKVILMGPPRSLIFKRG